MAAPRSAFANRTVPGQAPGRADADIVTARVVEREMISLHLVRITIQAEEFRSETLVGPDQYFGLFMPKPGTNYVPPRPYTGGNIRRHCDYLSEEERPDLRWYTVRHLDRDAGTVCFDVATHGVNETGLMDATNKQIGPGLRWVLTTRPGDTVGYFPSGALWQSEPMPQVLVADSSSAPSVWSILDFQRAFRPEALSETHLILAEVTGDPVEPLLVERAEAELASVVVHRDRRENLPGRVSQLMRRRRPRRYPGSRAGYVWACGERDLARAARDAAVEDWGLPHENVLWSPYWIAGQPRP